MRLDGGLWINLISYRHVELLTSFDCVPLKRCLWCTYLTNSDYQKVLFTCYIVDKKELEKILQSLLYEYILVSRSSLCVSLYIERQMYVCFSTAQYTLCFSMVSQIRNYGDVSSSKYCTIIMFVPACFIFVLKQTYKLQSSRYASNLQKNSCRVWSLSWKSTSINTRVVL